MRMLLATWVTLSLILTGCQRSAGDGVAVSGVVEADGRPVSGVVITLEPIRGTTGPNASSAVFDGRFEIPSDAGLHGGEYRARFSMIPAELRASLPPEVAATLPPEGAAIDPAYDANSQLSCSVEYDRGDDSRFEIEFLDR